MISLSTLALDDSNVASSVALDDGTTASALSDTKKLQRHAIALLIHSGATGNLKYKNGNGQDRTIDVSKWAQGVWHLVKIQQIFATGTTVAAADFSVGWARY